MIEQVPEVMSEEFKPSSERLAEALERARRYWQKRREALASQAALAAPGEPPPPFTIALSREAGTNAGEVARAIGERVGWHVYDHELVEWIARQMGVRTALLETIDEKRMSWLEELFRGFSSGPMLSETAYVDHLTQTLFALAAHGECVIVGRGAAQVLPPETTLRVRLVGPLRDRIAAVRRRFSLSEDEAKRWVEQTDQERRAFVQDHFARDPADPAGYDLLLNVFRFTPAECADQTVTALHQLQGHARRQAEAGAAKQGQNDHARRAADKLSSPDRE